MTAFVLTEIHQRVGLLRLNRPEVRNALNDALFAELNAALDHLEADDNIGCLVLTGDDKAFAAGSDISALADIDFPTAYQRDLLAHTYGRLGRCRKPVIAAVAGYALGGGCELAMMCDMIFAADTARFGQPEVKIGVLPGAGGTQRLPRVVGKAKAMDLCLTGRMMNAEEAERAGLVARIYPAATLLEETLAAAQAIAGYSLPVVMMIKEAVQRADEMPLGEGLLFERRLFHAAFALEDQEEGMKAFLEKRTPQFKHR